MLVTWICCCANSRVTGDLRRNDTYVTSLLCNLRRIFTSSAWYEDDFKQHPDFISIGKHSPVLQHGNRKQIKPKPNIGSFIICATEDTSRWYTLHTSDVIMSAMASQTTGVSIVYCTARLLFHNNIPALVQVLAWRRPGDKPLSEPLAFSLLTYMHHSPSMT